MIRFPNGTVIKVEDAVFNPTARANLIGFRDLKRNEYLVIPESVQSGKHLLEPISKRVLETLHEEPEPVFPTTHITPSQSWCYKYQQSTYPR